MAYPVFDLSDVFSTQAAPKEPARLTPAGITAFQTRYKHARALMMSVPEGRALLSFADALPVRIFPNPHMQDMGAHGKFNPNAPQGSRVDINPFLSVDELIITLSHELRHAWQHTHCALDDSLPLNPVGALLLMRLAEGDANAHAALVLKRICDATGMTARIPFLPPAQDGDDNSNAGILRRVFKTFQTNDVETEDYDMQVLAQDYPWYFINPLNAKAGISTIMSAGIDGFDYLDAAGSDDFLQKLSAMVPDVTMKNAAWLTAKTGDKYAQRKAQAQPHQP